jgi:hypothetical protein
VNKRVQCCAGSVNKRFAVLRRFPYRVRWISTIHAATGIDFVHCRLPADQLRGNLPLRAWNDKNGEKNLSDGLLARGK